VVFTGGFADFGVFCGGNGGEVVVNCVVDRGVLCGVFRVEKHATFLDFIFAGFPFWE